MQLMIRIPSVEKEQEDSSTDEQVAVNLPDGGSNEEKCDGTKRKLQDLNEWAIVEMQGDLESRIGDVQLDGKFVGSGEPFAEH